MIWTADTTYQKYPEKPGLSVLLVDWLAMVVTVKVEFTPDLRETPFRTELQPVPGLLNM